ncbi:hypothetical protein FA95DRAFT_1612617, partial [Auriscalpium vulgare]
MRSLTVWMLVPDATLEQLTALESLVIGRLPTKPLTLPRTLRHFGLHQRRGLRVDQTPTSLPDAGGSPSAGPLAASLLDSVLPELRVVSATGCSKADLRHALKTASEALGA